MALTATGQTDPNSGAAFAGTTAAPTASPAGSAPGKDSILRQMVTTSMSGSGMSDEGRKYMDILTEVFKFRSSQSGGQPVQITYLPDPAGVVVLECNGRFTFLIFQEYTTGIKPSIPTTVVVQSAFRSYGMVAGKNISGLKILPPIVITKQDYPKADKMANWIYATFVNQEDALTAEALNNEQLYITVNGQDCDAFGREWSPHGVMARSNIAFKLSIIPKGNRTYDFQGKDNIFNNYRSEMVDVATVNAYVEIINGPRRMDTNTQMFTPVVHITDVVTRAPNLRLYLMLLALSAEVFIKQGFWKNQFMSFKKDKPNLGNLLVESNGELSFIDKQASLDDFIFRYMTPPVLAIDVTDGRARVPGTELFVLTDPEHQMGLRSEVQALFRGQPVTLPDHINLIETSYSYSEFVGSFPSKDGYLDTRYIADYLQLAVHFGKTNSAEIAQFLNHYPNDAAPRFEMLQRFYKEITALYANSVAFCNLDFVGAIQDALRSFIQLAPNSYTPTAGAMDLSGLVKDASSYLSRGAGAFGAFNGSPFQAATIQPSMYGTPRR